MDETDGFPFCPSHEKINPENLSPFTVDLANQCSINIERATDLPKLCLTHKDKSHYVCHSRKLQLYIKHGIKVTKIHRAVTFTQSEFLVIHDLRQRQEEGIHWRVL